MLDLIVFVDCHETNMLFLQRFRDHILLQAHLLKYNNGSEFGGVVSFGFGFTFSFASSSNTLIQFKRSSQSAGTTAERISIHITRVPSNLVAKRVILSPMTWMEKI